MERPICVSSPLKDRPFFKIFIKEQNGIQIFNNGSNFNYITGKNAAFHVTKNTFFKITFQGTAEQHIGPQIRMNLQILVNDYIISGKELKSNTTPNECGGYYWMNPASHTAVFVSRMAMIYLRPGTYSFNIGVRTDFPSLQVLHGMAHYELTQFNEDADLGGLPLMTVPSP